MKKEIQIDELYIAGKSTILDINIVEISENLKDIKKHERKKLDIRTATNRKF